MRTSFILLLAVGVASTSCASQGTPAAQPGVLSGVVMSHPSQGGDEKPLANALVGVYHEAVSVGGPLQQDAPKPVHTTRTDGSGAFAFNGLTQGRWFVLAMNEAGGGTWVNFDPAKGAHVTLVVCTDCPVPA